jgi:hypothetical protein
MWDERARQSLLARIEALRPETPARWGRMTCPQMVVHVTDALALYTGDLSAVGKHTPLRYPPFKQAFVYLLPIPKNVPTAAVLKARIPGDWQAETDRLAEAVARFCAQQARAAWPVHPLFGRLSARAYGVLAYKHTDHHLRQFGA